MRTAVFLLAVTACSLPAQDSAEPAPWSDADASATPIAGAEQLPPPAGDLTLDVAGGLLGGSMTFVVNNAGAWEDVFIFRSMNGIGSTSLGPLTVDMNAPVRQTARVTTDGAGYGGTAVGVPDMGPLVGAEVCFQAVSWPGLEQTDVHCIQLDHDDDGDGSLNYADICPGYDDNADGDADGAPDGCDACPLDNPDDTDFDGACDSDDPCPLDPLDDSDLDGSCDSDDPCPDDPSDACVDVGECLNLGWKRGSEDWTCPAGYRLPTIDEWDRASACMSGDDLAMIDYYHNVAVEVGGCNCKWNDSWCGEPSIETYDGRMCGDYTQLHLCVGEYAHDNGLGMTWYNEVPTGTINEAQAQEHCERTYPGQCEYRGGDCAGPGWCYNGDPGYEPCWGWEAGCSGEAGRVWEYGSSYTTYGTWN